MVCCHTVHTVRCSLVAQMVILFAAVEEAVRLNTRKHIVSRALEAHRPDEDSHHSSNNQDQRIFDVRNLNNFLTKFMHI